MHMQRQMDVGRRSNAAERAEMDAAGEIAIQRSDGRVVLPYKKNLLINGTVGAAGPYCTTHGLHASMLSRFQLALFPGLINQLSLSLYRCYYMPGQSALLVGSACDGILISSS
jgi:hypothetical protein